MTRKWERIIGLIGMILVTGLLGGFSATVNLMKPAQYEKILAPMFASSLQGVSAKQGLLMFKTLGAWFGYTVIIVLTLGVIANLLLRHHKRVRLAGGLYLIAGVVTLLGSQLIAYPLAFIFFVVAVLCFMRKEKNIASDNDSQSDPAGVQS
ncbi:DUF4064 domain-containing protein [Lacticaseibacillus jixiensis]|uniref:DUF4064 domain-containing protein n=1 Tax=Lacticaseibacillus jixiensis TaxID=3231926 RepID=UPI0036F29471